MCPLSAGTLPSRNQYLWRREDTNHPQILAAYGLVVSKFAVGAAGPWLFISIRFALSFCLLGSVLSFFSFTGKAGKTQCWAILFTDCQRESQCDAYSFLDLRNV